jgi:hypothetical protein
MRGLPAFEDLWDRRTTIETDKEPIEVLGLPDLVTAKKTQRDKDWPMITRLLEAHYVQRSESPVDADIDFWLRESRTPAVLIDVARSWRDRCRAVQSVRPLLVHAIAADEVLLNEGLRAEETREREADRAYWEPLKRELEALRRARRDGSRGGDESRYGRRRPATSVNSRSAPVRRGDREVQEGRGPTGKVAEEMVRR